MEYHLQITAQYGFYLSWKELFDYLATFSSLNSEITKFQKMGYSQVQIISHLASNSNFPFATSNYPNDSKLYLSYLPWLGSPQFKFFGKVFIGICLNTFQIKQLLDPLFHDGLLPTNQNLHLQIPQQKIKQVTQFFDKYFNYPQIYPLLIQKKIFSYLKTPSVPKLYYFPLSDWPGMII